MNDRPRRCPFASLFGGGRPPADEPSHARRRVLIGLGAAGGTLGLAGTGEAVPPPTAPALENDGTQERQSFHGSRQSGVVNPEPAAALFVAFDVLADSRADLQRLFRTLTARIAFLMQGGPADAADRLLPPPDSGLLGPEVIPDNLTVTVSVGASLFDERFGLTARKPRRLAAMPHFPNDAMAKGMTHGDLLLQFCANTAETNIHALRDILKTCPDLLAVRWTIDGFLPPHTIRKLGRDTVRNMLGFKDGTANLDARDSGLMDRHVWVGDADVDEPAWARNGSYHVVRMIRTLVERWDRTTLAEQEQIIGRHKDTGAPLGLKNERDIPDYASDPDGKRIPLNAHIRLANPRTPDTESSLILRRPYNYSRGLTAAGQLDMGLIFVSFQANVETGFAAVQGRLDGEPLEEYIKPFGGGYFFTLPGVPSPAHYLGQSLLEGVPDASSGSQPPRTHSDVG